MADRPCPLLSVQPSRALLDERFTVHVLNLQPQQRVTVHVLHCSEDQDVWEAFGHYVGDASGAVDVSTDVCLGGTYDGVEPMGLVWSIRPVPESRKGIRLRKKDVQTPMVLTISVYPGHLTEGFGQHTSLASAVVERWYVAPGVRRVTVSGGEVTATLFLPPGPGPFPAVLDLGGGGGGLMEARSALLASHGFVSMVLEYVSPRTSGGSVDYVGNRYFENAFMFLQQHPQVCMDRVAIWGLSFGTSVALSMAVNSSVVKPRCLVCVSGSHVQPAQASISEIFADYALNFKSRRRFDEENCLILHDLLLPIPTDLSKKLDMGRLPCPLLLVLGEDDQNWPAVESAEDMKEMVEKAGNSHLLTVLSYPNAGHLIEPPYSPHFRSSNFPMGMERKISVQRHRKFLFSALLVVVNENNRILSGDALAPGFFSQCQEMGSFNEPFEGPRRPAMVLWGGETIAHAKAQEDSWLKALDFLKKHLFQSPGPAAAPHSLL